MNGTIARLTRISLLRGWRGLLLALLPIALLLLAVMMRVTVGEEESITRGLLGGLNAGTVIPLVALIIGTGAISTEIDDGSIVYLLTKPIKRWKIIATKYVVAMLTALAFAAVPTFVAGVILTGGVTDAAIGYAVAAAVSCVVYCALFILLGVVSRQAVIIGLMYVLLWENLVCGLVSGARVVSVQYWSTSVASEVAPDTIVPDVNVTVAAVLAVIATGTAIWYAGQRLRSLTLAGDS